MYQTCTMDRLKHTLITFTCSLNTSRPVVFAFQNVFRSARNIAVKLVYVRACMRVCMHASMHVCVRACVHRRHLFAVGVMYCFIYAQHWLEPLKSAYRQLKSMCLWPLT